MARREFTEVPYRYGDNKYGFAQGQTRDGVEEFVQAVELRKLNSATGLLEPSDELAQLKAELAEIKSKLTDGSLKAQLSGSFATLRPMIGGTKTATSVASEVFAGASRKAGRRGMAIKIEHPYLRCRIDGLNVTDTTGVAMEPFSQAVITFDPAVDVPVYIISEAGIVRYGVVEW